MLSRLLSAQLIIYFDGSFRRNIDAGIGWAMYIATQDGAMQLAVPGSASIPPTTATDSELAATLAALEALLAPVAKRLPQHVAQHTIQTVAR